MLLRGFRASARGYHDGFDPPLPITRLPGRLEINRRATWQHAALFDRLKTTPMPIPRTPNRNAQL